MFSIMAASFTRTSSSSVAISADRAATPRSLTLVVRDYDLAATLSSGQAFRWMHRDGAWTGVIENRWVRLRSDAGSLVAETVEPVEDWSWLTEYLQTDVDLASVVATFPADESLGAAARKST